MNKKIKVFVLAVLTAAALPAFADVRLPSIISDHMVLQKAAKVPVWGWADPGERVVVTLNGQAVSATAGSDGKWRVDLNLQNSPPHLVCGTRRHGRTR